MLVSGFDLERLRPRLLGLAYRMLGSRDEAEDAVQEAFLRWHQAETAEIRSPEAWLITVLSRLCVDRLRALTTQREHVRITTAKPHAPSFGHPWAGLSPAPTFTAKHSFGG